MTANDVTLLVLRISPVYKQSERFYLPTKNGFLYAFYERISVSLGLATLTEDRLGSHSGTF